MSLQEVKQQVLEANRQLPGLGLVKLTWGNVSGLDAETGLVVIKPSGVPYERLTIDDLVVVDLDGRVVEGRLNPSSDTPTHVYLYRSFRGIGGIVHVHSPWATIFAQAGRPIPPLGTTHADHFYGEVPCTRALTEEEISGHYELETGKVIAEAFRQRDPLAVPAVLVRQHAPFCWGKDALDALRNAIVLEEAAKFAYHTMMLNPRVEPIGQSLLDKHYQRKHGPGAYYGQREAAGAAH
ncbi:L-ribulose-5-phosphate 4-epimerase [Alicyclobacillus cellulosilyticus]|uniref:L-ribulose-5-phosphate 4-epimerase n=1 Tax=Alicyclobacillus cellulosilyticus TaxID=1003997 RepID=A0A917KJ15_9BACL|nr:L-ribulose-5-phosphate 4-epimerase [Alicyclobacillus cellulosilyticus]GGJ14158.1 L-ribulose-5-phosphate 4-epimerase [Alicyclobacillus cellulosilyticus]